MPLKFKDLKCNSCDTTVEVEEDIIAVKCWKCTTKLVPPPEIRKPIVKNGARKPRGWQLMKVFVDADGNVYHKGKEQPKLKGSLNPTIIKKKTQLEKDLEQIKKEKKLAEKYKKKQKLKKLEEEKNETTASTVGTS